MATISFKCDTCKRSVELVENPQGFTVVGKCVITNGCTGRLYRTERNPNNVRESSPNYVAGLNNYVPRRALYEFEQTLSADKWKVKHDMGVLPSTFVYLRQEDGSHVLVDNSTYKVSPIDKNTIMVTFTSKVRGIIQCVAKSTVPLVPSTVAPETSQYQVSANGIITFAVPKYLTQIHGQIPQVSAPTVSPTITPSPTPTSTPIGLPLNLCAESATIQIEIEITKPNEDPFVCFENIDNLTDSRSPWNGWGEVLVGKRRNYCIRTATILKLAVFGNADLESGDIPDGTRIRFLRIDYGTGRKEAIPSRGLLMLLAKNPYAYADKVKDRVVDVGELLGDSPDYFVYRGGELFLDESKVERSYPDISRVIYQAAPPQPSPTPTPTLTPTITATISVTPTLSVTPSTSVTPEATQTATPTMTAEPTATPTPTVTPTATPELPYDSSASYLVLNAGDPNHDNLVYADPGFDDSSWSSGFGGFGSSVPDGAQSINTSISPGTDRRIWLRKWVDFPQTVENIRIDIWRDDGAQIWWNGVQLPTVQTADYFAIYAIVPSDMITGNDLVALRVTDGRNDADQGPVGSANIYASMTLLYSTDPVPSWTPTPTPTRTPNATSTPTPTISVTPSVTLTPGLSMTPSPTVTATPTITPTISPTISVTPSITPTISLTPTITPTISVTPTFTPTPTSTPPPDFSILSKIDSWFTFDSNIEDQHGSSDLNTAGTVTYSPAIIDDGAASTLRMQSNTVPPALITRNNFTIGGWVKLANLSPQVFVGTKINSESGLNESVFIYYNGGQIGGGFNQTSLVGDQRSIAYTLPDGGASMDDDYQFFALTYTGGILSIYLNGSRVVDGNFGSDIPRVPDMIFFGYQYSAEYNQSFDEVFFADALTDAELDWLYNSGNGRSYADVVAAVTTPTPTVTPTVTPSPSQP